MMLTPSAFVMLRGMYLSYPVACGTVISFIILSDSRRLPPREPPVARILKSLANPEAVPKPREAPQGIEQMYGLLAAPCLITISIIVCNC